jgi:hypothetical protein
MVAYSLSHAVNIPTSTQMKRTKTPKVGYVCGVLWFWFDCYSIGSDEHICCAFNMDNKVKPMAVPHKATISGILLMAMLMHGVKGGSLFLVNLWLNLD